MESTFEYEVTDETSLTRPVKFTKQQQQQQQSILLQFETVILHNVFVPSSSLWKNTCRKEQCVPVLKSFKTFRLKIVQDGHTVVLLKRR